MDFTDSVTVAVDPDTLFAYVGNVEKLPRYVTRVLDAQRMGESVVIVTEAPTPGGERLRTEGWVRVKPERRLEWGVHGSDAYRGELSVVATDTGSLLLVTLHMEAADFTAVNHGLAEALQGLKRVLEGGSG